jgi:hypothetical protein
VTRCVRRNDREGEIAFLGRLPDLLHADDRAAGADAKPDEP